MTLAASPTSVIAGSAAVLTWTSVNATACTATGAWTGAQGTNGTQSTGALTEQSTYSLTCTGPGGASSPATVIVDVVAPPVPTVALTANAAAVAAGSAAVLTWSSTNATSCTASGGWSGYKASSGAVSTGPLSSTTAYSITCSGAGGTSSPASVTVVSGTVAVTPSVGAITLSQTQRFQAASAVAGAVTWAVDGIAGGNVTVGIIDASGLYTPGTVPGRHAVTATNVAYPVITGAASAAVTDLAGVYTYHNDSSRDGANTQEYALTPSNVNTTSFGKLFSCAVDGAIYGQPLWVPGLRVNSAIHNVVFVATEHDSLYAFDADANPCALLWSVSLIDGAHGAAAGETTVPSGVSGYLVGHGVGDIAPEVGVTGTPVIDPTRNLLYVISKSVDAGQTMFYQRLHAIDLTTGNEATGSPTTVGATYPGSGDGGTTVNFNSRTEAQRAGLALVNGALIATWASHEDTGPWYGWVMSYTYGGTSFSQNGVFNVAPDAQKGGIWMSGAAPASDSNGNLYLVTGNGTFDATSSVAPDTDYGDSLLQLNGALGMSQYFTPTDEASSAGADNDFGAGGAAVLANLPAGSPVPHLLVCGGKVGNVYLLNRDLLGGFGDGAAVQKIALGHRIFATGAYWNSHYYLTGDQGPLVEFALSASSTPMSLAAASSHLFGFGGSTPSISAAAAQNGIVWSLDNAQYCSVRAPGCGPTVLYAHDAADVTTELWDSSMVAGDAAGYAVKFTVPTVANGKVYVGTRGNNTGGAPSSSSVAGELDVYGLR